MRNIIAPLLRILVDFKGLMTLRCGGRRAVAVWVAAATLNLCTMSALAFPKGASEIPTGMINIGGVVTIDGSLATSGQTIYSGSSIVTGQRSESRLDLGNLTRLKLYAESTLTLGFSRSTLSGSLESGSLHGFVPSGVRADIVTTDASIATDPGQPAAFSIQVLSGRTTISVDTGQVEIRTGNGLRSVVAGETFSTNHGASLLPEPQQNLNSRKRVWLLVGIGAAVAVLLVAITGDREDTPPAEGCAVVLSGEPPFSCRP